MNEIQSMKSASNKTKFMYPFSYIERIILVFSILFNFYLLNLSLKQISVKECFSANDEYKRLFIKETKNLEECLERELLMRMQRTHPIRTTTLYPKYEEQLKMKHSAPCRSLEELNDTYINNAFVKNCITGDFVAKLDLNATKTLNINFNSGYYGQKENGKKRWKAFEEVFVSRAWGRDWDPDFKGLSASGSSLTKTLQI